MLKRKDRDRLVQIVKDIDAQILIAPDKPIYLSSKDFELFKNKYENWQLVLHGEHLRYKTTHIMRLPNDS